MPRLPPSVEPLFQRAGWRPSAAQHEQPNPAASAQERAAAVIAEFGGLLVGAVGPGRELASSNVHFYSRVRPEVTAIVQAWSSQLGELAGVATAHHDHIVLFVSSAGSFYAFTDPDDRLYSIGQTFGEAMERLLLGIGSGPSIPRDA